MFKKRLIIPILSLITIHSFGQQTIDTLAPPPPPPPPKQRVEKNNAVSKTTIWKNDDYPIKVLIPSDWQHVTPNQGEIVSFASSKKEIFSIRAYTRPFPGTLDEIKQKIETSFKAQFPSFKLMSSQVRKVGSLEITDIILSGKIGSSSGIYRGIYFSNAVNSFIVTCFYSASSSKQYNATLDGILKSVSFD